MIRFLSCAFVLGFINLTFSQNPTLYYEDFDGITPCFLTWIPEGSFQGAPGHDINNMTYDSSVGDGALVLDVKTHATNHGPLYYRFSAGDDLSCDPGNGQVDVSTTYPVLGIRAKATENMQIKIYLQEGNNPSWDYARLSATPLILNLSTTYKCFTLENFDTNPAAGSDPIDLSSIGGLAIELGKSDGTNFDQVDGKIYIDFIGLGDAIFDCTIGSTDNPRAFSYNLYPNPSDGNFKVEFENIANSSITIFGINGDLIETKKSSGDHIISFSNNLSAGVYFVHINTSKGTEVSKLVVK